MTRAEPISELNLSPAKSKSSGFLSRLSVLSSQGKKSKRNILDHSGDQKSIFTGKYDSISTNRILFNENTSSSLSLISTSSSTLSSSVQKQLVIRNNQMEPTLPSISAVTFDHAKLINGKIKLLGELETLITNYRKSYSDLSYTCQRIAENLASLSDPGENDICRSYLHCFQEKLQELSCHFERQSNQFYKINDENVDSSYKRLYETFQCSIKACKEYYDPQLKMAQKQMNGAQKKSEKTARKTVSKQKLHALSQQLQDLSSKVKDFERLKVEKMHFALTEQASFTEKLVKLLESTKVALEVDEGRVSDSLQVENNKSSESLQLSSNSKTSGSLQLSSKVLEIDKATILEGVSVQELRKKFMSRIHNRQSRTFVPKKEDRQLNTNLYLSEDEDEKVASDSCASPTTSDMQQAYAGIYLRTTTKSFRDQLHEDYKAFANNSRLTVEISTPTPDDADFSFFTTGVASQVCKLLKLRQQVTATAIVFFKRFYHRSGLVPTPSFYGTEDEMRESQVNTCSLLGYCDPSLVIATSIFVATKAEECPIHAKLILQELKNYCISVKAKFMAIEVPMIHEFELYLLETLDFSTIVYHPYKYLAKLMEDAVLPFSARESDDFVKNAFFILNDSYKWDTCMFYPPHLIALSAIFFGIAFKASDPGTLHDHHEFQMNDSKDDFLGQICLWFAQLSIDLQVIVDIVQGWIKMYKQWSNLNGFEEIDEILQILRNKA